MKPLGGSGPKSWRLHRHRAPDEVVIEERGVGDGVLHVEWDQMLRISLVVRRRRGVPLPAPGWAFVIEAAAGTVTVPAGQSEALLSQTHHLRGFDHTAVTAALSRGQSIVVTVYQAGGQPNFRPDIL